MGFYSEFLNIL